MFKYRLYPSQKQQRRLFKSFAICKGVYNELLGLNKKLWLTRKFDLNSLIKDIKTTCPEHYVQAHSQVLQNISDRLSKAFDNFFRRLKDPSCKEKGFPRFKSRIASITYPQSGFQFLSDKHLKVSKIGSLPIILHRIPKGKIKTLTIKVNSAGQWFAVFSCEVSTPEVKHPSFEAIGIDVGLEAFATLSNSPEGCERIPPPKFLIKSERKLKKIQRRHSRKVKGSNNREKSRVKLARAHLKVANQRTDFLHKESCRLAKAYAFLCGEDLNITKMVRNHVFAKGIHDAGWGRFIQMLSYKAVTCGGQFIPNPKTAGSSSRCSRCGMVMEMPLSERTFQCSACGLCLHRDHNACLNHVKDTAGLAGILTLVDTGPLQQGLPVASSVVEAGTICDLS